MRHRIEEDSSSHLPQCSCGRSVALESLHQDLLDEEATFGVSHINYGLTMTTHLLANKQRAHLLRAFHQIQTWHPTFPTRAPKILIRRVVNGEYSHSRTINGQPFDRPTECPDAKNLQMLKRIPASIQVLEELTCFLFLIGRRPKKYFHGLCQYFHFAIVLVSMSWRWIHAVHE